MFNSQLLSLLRGQRTKNYYCILVGNTIFKQRGENQLHSFSGFFALVFCFVFPKASHTVVCRVMGEDRMGCLILATIQVDSSFRLVIH